MSVTGAASPHPFDVVFTDTCLGGCTVAARIGASDAGLRGYFLADYAAIPLNEVRGRSRVLFPGWAIESIDAAAIDPESRLAVQG